MTRQEVLGLIFLRAEGLRLTRKTRKLAATLRGQRLIMSMYELERRKAAAGRGAPPAEEPDAQEMTRLLILAGQMAWEHAQAEKEGNGGCG